MPIAWRVDEEIVYAVLEGELTIFTVADLKDDLFGLLNHPGVVLDLAQVSELDGCAAQMLAILLKEAAQTGRHMRIVRSNPQVDEALQWLGVVTVCSDETETGHGSKQG